MPPEKERSTNPINHFVIKHFLIAVLLAINLVALVSLIAGWHRLLGSSESDVGGYLEILATLLPLLPLTRASYFLIYKKKSPSLPKLPSLYKVKLLTRFILIGFISLWSLSLVLWLVIIPWRGHADFNQAIEAKSAKNFSQAIDSFHRSLYKLDEYPEAHYHLAEIYAELADYKKAKQHYRLGIYADPIYPKESFNNLALLLLQDADAIGALDLLDLAEARVHEESDQNTQWAQIGVIHKNRAWAYWKLGMHEQATEEINKAIKNILASNTISEYPEVNCLAVLIAGMTGNLANTAVLLPEPQAREACKNAYREVRKNTQAKSINGASRELYIQVLK